MQLYELRADFQFNKIPPKVKWDQRTMKLWMAEMSLVHGSI